MHNILPNLGNCLPKNGNGVLRFSAAPRHGESGRATLHEWALIFYGTSTLPDRTEYALYNPAGVSIPRRPFVKPRETAFSKAQNSLTSPKNKQPQHKSEKSGNLSPPYVVNAQIQSQRKGKARGQHKNGKSANKPTPRPTVQTLRGLTAARGPNPAGEVRLITSRPRGRSTPSPVTTTVAPTRPTTTTSTPRVAMRQRILNIVTASSLQRGLILLEPPAKPIVDNVPEIFQQYSKIQQLYPLYPVYAGVRGPGQHATRAKGLELLQDEQFDSKNFDKGIPISLDV